MQNVLEGSQLKPVLWSPGDASWIDQANQILKDRGQRQIATNDCPSIVWIPTGFAMWRNMAEALGWPDKPIGWKQIIELAGDPQGWARYGHPEWQRFTFGHSQPPYSTFGFNVLASLAYAAAGKTEGLTPADVRSQQVVDAFRTVEKETFHYGASTSSLLNLMAQYGPRYLHAATTSETAFLYSAVKQPDLQWPFIFPAEGTFWSDNPTCILKGSWVSEEQQAAAKIYRDFLLSPAAQSRAVEIGLRPADPKTPLQCPICLEKGTDPRVTPKTVPPLGGVSGETNDAILDVFKATKKKATVALLLDTSTSMEGVAMKNAVAGAKGFLTRLHKDDEIEAYMFNDTVQHLEPSGRAGDAVEKLSATIGNLYADGNTALYDAVCAGVDQIEAMRKEDIAAGESRLYAVVLLSDGRNTTGNRSETEMFGCLPGGEDVEEVKVYTIAYGDQADKDLLKRISGRTHGKSFESDPENIAKVYQDISAEQ
jgi:Ca-activated chloride channel family protein